MESNISNAFLLLIIGMITVFIVLLLVVIAGKILIRLVNKYAPEQVSKRVLRPSDALDPRIIAVMSGVVDHVTHGKGVLVSIKKTKS